MDRLRAMRMFVRVAEAGSFTQAAHGMQVPRSTASSLVRQLESHLGVQLLQRTTRSVSLTFDGTVYLERCRHLLDELEETEALLQQRVSEPRGKLRVDAPSRLARTIIIPALDDFFARYPEIELELGVSDRPVDLIQDGVDCAIRVGEPPDSRLIAHRIGVLMQGNYASPSYLEHHGMPSDPSELPQHLAVNYASPLTGRVYEWEYVESHRTHTVPMRSLVTVNNAEAYIACARAGLGLIQVPSYDVQADLAANRLVTVLDDWRPEFLPISVLYSHRRHLSRRVHTFVEWAEALFKRALWPPSAT